MAIQKQKVLFFEAIIADFFSKSGRSELPWRKPKIGGYEVWVSEIMLQQTQVSRVIGYYQRFLKKFPTVEKLAKSSWEEFLPYYEGLGYYARGRNMLKTAQKVQIEHGGVFPKTKEALLALPGVGDYTASAILSFAYGKNHLAWDTNLKRVIGRFFYGSKKAEIEIEKIEALLQLPRKKLNAALMDFGSSICTAKPKCHNCPLQTKCVYFKNKGVQEYIAPKEKNNFPTQNAQVVLFLHQNHQKYFSPQTKIFQPFVLDKAIQSRPLIKAHFLEKYGLRLSVRPPHKKGFLQGKPTLFVNAQILAGKHEFFVFPKSALTEYTKDNC